MLTYDLKVGYSCNNLCKHCVIADSKEKLIQNNISSDLTTEECLRQIDEELQKGIARIVLTGGEVTVRKDFDTIIKKCVESDLAITVQTNGRRLGSEHVIRAVKDVEDIKFIVALHGANASTHDNITQVKGSFAETCKGISVISEYNKLVILKVVISQLNAFELPDIVTLAQKLGVKYICFAFPHGQGDARKNFDEIIPRYSYLVPVLEKVIEMANKLGINIEFEAIPYCIIPKHMHLVGELKYLKGNAICTQVKEETFDWNEVRKAIKKKGANCFNCVLDSICEGPWMEYVTAFGDDELRPIIVTENQKERILSAISKFQIQDC